MALFKVYLGKVAIILVEAVAVVVVAAVVLAVVVTVVVNAVVVTVVVVDVDIRELRNKFHLLLLSNSKFKAFAITISNTTDFTKVVVVVKVAVIKMMRATFWDPHPFDALIYRP